MRFLFPAVICVLALAGAAHAQAISIVDSGPNFRWRIVPDWMQISEALDSHVAGNTPQHVTTTVECTINKSYRPDDCKIIEEPIDSGLGKGAAEVAKLYRALSVDETGKSTVGRRIRLSFTYGGMRF